MTSAFKTGIAEGLAVLYSVDYADAITYNGAAIYGFLDRTPFQGANSVSYAARLQVRVSDVPAPAYRTTVVCGIETWLTGQPEDCEGDGFEWRIPLTRGERPKKMW